MFRILDEIARAMISPISARGLILYSTRRRKWQVCAKLSQDGGTPCSQKGH
jgi:hypothetical protein